ncbi:MAG TPA: MucR family transcriptional regulator [Caulobacteraceae bacterium]|jgi:predicted transcriptional regulator
MPQSDETSLSKGELLRLCADIVGAYLGRNATAPNAVTSVIGEVYHALERLGSAAVTPAEPPVRQKPAVPVARSVQHDYIVCLEDGKKLKMLKRYLKSRFDLTPEEYRRKWGLPPEYPMVAPAYAERRSAFAKQIGLGRGVRRRGT